MAEDTAADAMGDLDFNSANGGGYENGGVSGEPFPLVEQQELKKKRKKKKKNKPKNPQPSGFEENHVEGPLTYEASLEENELYDLSKPFSERIETCIQRYKAKRKFDHIRSQLFTTYLNIGGIRTGPKQFSGGLDLKNNDHLDAGSIAALAATDFVPGGIDTNRKWEVDFAYVVRGFLSHKVPYGLGYVKVEDLELAARFIRNFLNYVIYHNVAPEYFSSIQEALHVCDLAEKELVLCRHVSCRLPGFFNMACSTLWDGYYAGMRVENQTWDDDSRVEQPVGLTTSQAKEIFNACAARRGTAAQKEIGLDTEVIRAEYVGMEVTTVIYPTQDKDKIGEPEVGEKKEQEGGYAPTGMNALGKLIVKVWAPEGQEAPQTDLTEFEIWLEMDTLQFCFVGMHIEAKVNTLGSGIIWIDSVTAVQCSFYLFLENPPRDSDGSSFGSDDEFD